MSLIIIVFKIKYDAIDHLNILSERYVSSASSYGGQPDWD